MTPERFLGGIFRQHSGFIEIRVIEDKRGGRPVAREFYQSIDALLADLDRLRALAEARNAGIFYGVLPRRERDKGTAQDVLEGQVVWCDIDFKDFTGGEAVARERLAAFPVPPSIVVRSGHGLHAYWLLREQTDPRQISRLSKGIAGVLGGDHVFDAARILRLPGTLNLKDPVAPLQVQVEILEEDRTYNSSEIEETVDLFCSSGYERSTNQNRSSNCNSVPDGGVEIGDQLSERVQRLVHTNPRIQNLFWGRGKPPLGRDGRTLDASSSGYDFSLLLELLRKGIADESELATALNLRPDEAARAKGRRYILRTVQSAIELYEGRHGGCDAGAEPPPDPASQIDFEVEHVRIFSSDPARYELTITGKTMQLTSAQLKSPQGFALRYFDAHKRIPSMPDKGWAILVNDWLAGAEVVDAPPEASVDLAVAEAVEDAICDLRLKDDAQDLQRGGACLIEPEMAFFRLAPLLKVLKEDHPDITRPQLCLALRDLGWQPHKHTVEGREVRGWAGPADALGCAREEAPREDE